MKNVNLMLGINGMSIVIILVCSNLRLGSFIGNTAHRWKWKNTQV
jgi:hypothetical protein